MQDESCWPGQSCAAGRAQSWGLWAEHEAGMLPGEHPTTSKAAWTQNSGFSPRSSLSKLFSGAAGRLPGVSPSLGCLFASHDEDLKPGSPASPCASVAGVLGRLYPTEMPWQGAWCPGHVLSAVPASRLSPSSDHYPVLTFPIGTLSVPSIFLALGSYLALSCALMFPDTLKMQIFPVAAQ